MSNVLIGIIGVILFIGLALAGALFLGPRFQESANNSRGAAAVQAVQQVSNAVHMFQLNEGLDFTTTSFADLLSKGYLKTQPSSAAGTLYLVAADGCVGCTTGKAVGAVIAMSGDDKSKRTCVAVARQTGGVPNGQQYDPPVDTILNSLKTRPTGCSYDGSNYFIYSAF